FYCGVYLRPQLAELPDGNRQEGDQRQVDAQLLGSGSSRCPPGLLLLVGEGAGRAERRPEEGEDGHTGCGGGQQIGGAIGAGVDGQADGRKGSEPAEQGHETGCKGWSDQDRGDGEKDALEEGG